jgi:hypothetical protein
MKYLYTLFSLLIFVFQGCSLNSYESFPYFKEEELFLDKIRKTGIRFASKYNITFAGQTTTSPGGIIERAGLIFTTKENLSKELLRQILVDCSMELLSQMNSNPNVQPFVERFPLTIRNVKIVIHNKDKTNRDIFFPDTSTASLENGLLLFDSWTRGLLKIEEKSQETFEEALKKL